LSRSFHITWVDQQLEKLDQDQPVLKQALERPPSQWVVAQYPI